MKSNFLLKVHGASMSSTSNWTLGGRKVGWIGERSTPRTVLSGWSSAKSIAQIPVPVPTSRTRWRVFSLGMSAVKSLPSKINWNS